MGCLGKMCGASLFNTPDIAGLTGLFVNLLLLCVVEWVQREKLHGLDLSFVKHRCVRIGIYLFALFVIFAFGGNAENFIYFQF